jgi:peptidoglycan/xylan/chitin deacetylase (PgdA/CDA1 family)
MRRRLTVVTIVVVAVLVVAGAVTLIAITSDTPVAQPGPAASTPATTPSGVASSQPASPSGSPPQPPQAPQPPPPPAPGPTYAPGLPAGLLGEDIEVIPTSRPIVALTFDAGANPDAVPSILGTLSAEGVSATFFLTGDFASAYPSSVRAIAAAGHRVGNHTATHPHSLGLSDAELRNQLTTAEDQLLAAGAGDPHPLFRFPFGERDARTIATVNAAGYLPVRWTVDSLGWQGLKGRTEQQATQAVIDRVLGAAQPGEIVLMHVGSHPDDHTTLDAAALPSIIDRLQAAGYQFVTLDVLLS